MARSSHFIVPQLIFLEVKNYSLFDSDWRCEFKEGLNLFLGINSMGKTTTIKMITYGLAGKHEDLSEVQIDSEYFLERVNQEGEDPVIFLSFKLDEVSVQVSRNLKTDQIVGLVRGGVDLEPSVEEYESLLLKDGNIKSQSELASIAQRLLFREEEDEYLLWDHKAQSEILRILTKDVDFIREFEECKKEFDTAATKAKRTADRASQLQKQINTILEVEGEMTQNQPRKQNLRDLENDLNEKFNEKESLVNQSVECKENILELDLYIKTLSNGISSKTSLVDGKNEEFQYLERHFLKFAFEDDRLSLIMNKLSSLQMCTLCNTKLSKERANRAKKRLHEEGCPLCESEVEKKLEISEEEILKQSNRIEKLRGDILSMNDAISEQLVEYNHMTPKLDELNDNLSKIDAEIRQVNIEINYLKRNIQQIREAGNEDISSSDLRVDFLKKEIENLRPEITSLRQEEVEWKNKLDELNGIQVKKLDDILESLNSIFQTYAKKYFSEEVSLIKHQKQEKKSVNYTLSFLIPELKGKSRKTKNRVSTSERNILEYIFRVSMLEFYYENTGIAPTLLIETSEGSFDIDRTNQLAETLREVGQNGFPIIIVSNLSKPEYIKQLVSEEERSKRIFLILKYTDLNNRNKETINQALRELNLQEI